MTARISNCKLTDNQIAIVNNLRLLISVRDADHFLHSFALSELNDSICESCEILSYSCLIFRISFSILLIIYFVLVCHMYDPNKLTKKVMED